MKTQKTQKIQNGIVIDHIPKGNGRRCLEIIEEMDLTDKVLILFLNISSNKFGMKDMLKVEGIGVDPEIATRIALLAPNATINIIENYEVIKKTKLVLPERIKGLIECVNSRCVTHEGDYMIPEYEVKEGNPVTLKCMYCEFEFPIDRAKLKKGVI